MKANIMKALPVPRLYLLNTTRPLSTLLTVLLVSFVIFFSIQERRVATAKDLDPSSRFQVPADSQLFIAQRL
jgi:hypothetical protein